MKENKEYLDKDITNELENLPDSPNDKGKYVHVFTGLVIGFVIGLLFITLFTYKPTTTTQINDKDDDRFEYIYQQKNNTTTIYIVVDREKDVEYMVVTTPNGVGATTMRDTNGMVLLRE